MPTFEHGKPRRDTVDATAQHRAQINYSTARTTVQNQDKMQMPKALVASTTGLEDWEYPVELLSDQEGNQLGNNYCFMPRSFGSSGSSICRHVTMIEAGEGAETCK